MFFQVARFYENHIPCIRSLVYPFRVIGDREIALESTNTYFAGWVLQFYYRGLASGVTPNKIDVVIATLAKVDVIGNYGDINRIANRYGNSRCARRGGRGYRQ